jgi:hypothetical protein
MSITKLVSIEFFVFGRISCSETGGFARRHSVTKTDELFGYSDLSSADGAGSSPCKLKQELQGGNGIG